MNKKRIELPIIEEMMTKLMNASCSLFAYSMFIDDEDLEKNKKHLYEISQELTQIYGYIRDATGIKPRRQC